MAAAHDEPSSSPSARDALLAAAREELAERGHAGVGLRAVARRARLSHAAPAHFFADRAGLLTAVATEGFRQLTARLDRGVATLADDNRLAALGRVYVDFGLENPALVDLMFRGSELRPDDPKLLQAQREAISRLIAAVSSRADGSGPTGVPDDTRWALVSWALVHGLVALAREEALAGPAGRTDDDSAAVARDLVEFYASALARPIGKGGAV